MVGWWILAGEEASARKQILEAHQRAYALVQRMFVTDHDGVSLALGRRRELAIAAIEPLDLRLERSGGTAIIDDIVRFRESFAPRELRRHDRANRRRKKPASRNDAARG